MNNPQNSGIKQKLKPNISLDWLKDLKLRLKEFMLEGKSERRNYIPQNGPQRSRVNASI